MAGKASKLLELNPVNQTVPHGNSGQPLLLLLLTHGDTSHVLASTAEAWVKKRYPKWNPGKWKHGLKPAVPWCLNFDPCSNRAKHIDWCHWTGRCEVSGCAVPGRLADVWGVEGMKGR